MSQQAPQGITEFAYGGIFTFKPSKVNFTPLYWEHVYS